MPPNPVSAKFIKQQIDLVRDWIGRNIDVYTPTHSACTLCTPSGYYDSLNDTTFYSTCPVCQGHYWLDTTTKTTVLARVHWTGDEAITATPGGKYYVGDAWVVVDPSYRHLMEAAQSEAGKVTVDGNEMQIVKINPWGVPEQNRLRVVLKNMGERPS